MTSSKNKNEGYGNTEEFGKLEIENYCMGGTGVIISQGLMLEESDSSSSDWWNHVPIRRQQNKIVLKVGQKLPQCLENLYTYHEDVEMDFLNNLDEFLSMTHNLWLKISESKIWLKIVCLFKSYKNPYKLSRCIQRISNVKCTTSTGINRLLSYAEKVAKILIPVCWALIKLWKW